MQSDIHRHRVQMVSIILMCYVVHVLVYYVCSCNRDIVWIAQINENERKHLEEVERDRQILIIMDDPGSEGIISLLDCTWATADHLYVFTYINTYIHNFIDFLRNL